MAEFNDRFNTGGVNNDDMAEAPRRQKESASKTVAQVAAVVVALLCLAVVLIRGRQPALTPEQIVQQQDYEGEQRARRIFNLYSLKQDRARRDVARVEAEAQSASANQASSTIVTSPPRQHSNDSVVENATIVASANNYEKAELSREVPVQVISQIVAPSPQPVVDIELVETPSEPRVLPVYSLKNTAVLRESPVFGAAQLATISDIQTVTLFETNGDWAQVAANDGSGRTGYVLRSELVLPEEN